MKAREVRVNSEWGYPKPAGNFFHRGYRTFPQGALKSSLDFPVGNVYRCRICSFTASGGSLVMLGATLRPIGPHRFEGPAGTTVAFYSSGGAMKVTIEGVIEFTGVRVEDLHLGGAALAAYSGTYTSTELDATYKLSVEDGNLMLRTNWNRPLKLNPIVRDEFDCEYLGTLVFNRDSDDRVSGLSVFAGRIRNVTFEKTN